MQDAEGEKSPAPKPAAVLDMAAQRDQAQAGEEEAAVSPEEEILEEPLLLTADPEPDPVETETAEQAQKPAGALSAGQQMLLVLGGLAVSGGAAALVIRRSRKA